MTDTGIGIDPSLRATVLDAFGQADSSTTRRYGGTGLGLAICSQLVGMMGGVLDFTSEPGQGSTFWFEIPFGEASSLPAAQPVPTAATRAVDLLTVASSRNRPIRYLVPGHPGYLFASRALDPAARRPGPAG